MSNVSTLEEPSPFELLLAAVQGPRWMQHGLCRGVDPELFFPERGESTKDAKQTCKTCPVQERCREYAIENEEIYGIWGGMTVKELRSERMARRRARSIAA